MLRRKDVTLSREDLEAPEPDEPRELHSTRHNVRQLARELSSVRRRLDSSLDANRALAEHLESTRRHWRETAEWWEAKAETIIDSPMWRLTKPLRGLRSRLRNRRG